MEKGGINENSQFSFVAQNMSYNMHENITFGKKPVTPTKVQQNSSFLKRLLDDLLFTPEPPVKKNSWTLYKIKDHLHIDILSKLESLLRVIESQTAYIVALKLRVESQIVHILALESQIKELSILFKGNLQANMANWLVTKKIKTMADWVVAMVSITTSLSGLLNPANSSKSIQRLDQ